ncbi:unnamed protein product [Anisakis simplex]|uniref:Zinc finger CCCH domain-containing protein 14 n=1 Tax=Anisakis simplex TaxID=6269 RepID=A0A0M3IYE8_ANISI|nr:unnamed protein product [Anisakis simplex]
MAATSSEVSKKIRAAIKAKLEELGVYVDEELPDYIMVMIANKKEKSQMKDDLQLFLGKNSAKFVDWLFDIFDRLQTVGTTTTPPNTSTLSSSSNTQQLLKRKDSGDNQKTIEKSKDDLDVKKKDRKRRESDGGSKEFVEKNKSSEQRIVKEAKREHEKEDKSSKKRDKYEAKVVKSKYAENFTLDNFYHDFVLEVSVAAKRGDDEKRPEKVQRKEERKLSKEKSIEQKQEVKQVAVKERSVKKLEKKKTKAKEKELQPTEKLPATTQPPAEASAQKVLRKRRISPPPSAKGTSQSPLEHSRRSSVAHQEPLENTATVPPATVKPSPPPAPPKVSSVAVSRMSQVEHPKTVSSQIVVKRKLPDKENTKQNSGGVKSLFLKAIKEAGETTRIASQSAGYGGGAAACANAAGVSASKTSTLRKRENLIEPPRSVVSTATKRDDDELSVVEDEGIELDDYGDVEDALVVIPATTSKMSGGQQHGGSSSRSVVRGIEECVESEQEVDSIARKRRRITTGSVAAGGGSGVSAGGMKKDEEPTKFFITMKGGQRIPSTNLSSESVQSSTKLKVSMDDTKKEPERARKRRNEANPILAHLKLSDDRIRNTGNTITRRIQSIENDGERFEKKPRKEQKSGLTDAEKSVDNDLVLASDGVVLSEYSYFVAQDSVDSRRTPVWDGQIQLQEDDESSDDEAQIDAVLASTQPITVGFDEVPPTPTLTKPSFFLINNQSQSNARSGHVSYFKTSSISGSMTSNTSALGGGAGGEKLMERCKFWPNCRLEENCIYIHPNKPCSNFPNCHFGERCLYIHPLCKFDRTCTNPRCVYTHSPKAVSGAAAVTTTTAANSTAKTNSNQSTTKSDSSAVTSVKSSTAGNTPQLSCATAVSAVSTHNTTTSVTSAINAPLNSSIPCKFAGRCANPNCSFKHPKLCRFGERCTNRACYFWHPKLLNSTSSLNVVAKYKWKAPQSQPAA